MAAAAEPDVQMEITPASIELGQQQEVEILILVRNLSARSLQNLELHWFSDLALTVQSERLNAGRLQPGESGAWSVRIARSGDDLSPGTVHFRVTYVQVAEGAAGPVRGMAVGALEIKERPPQRVEDVAAFTIEAALDAVQEQRPGRVFLVVRNLSSVPVRLAAVRGHGPSFVSLGIPALGSEVALAPQASRVLPVDVTVGDTAQPGPQILVFEVDLSWSVPGHPRSGTLVATHSVEVGILGESDLLKLLGVPSFLFLPGFLFLTTYGTLRKRVSPKKAEGSDLSAAELALFSVTFSMIAAAFYPVASGLLGESRNYLQGYSLRDVFWVWFLSVGVGFLFWVFATGGHAALLRVRRAIAQAREEQERRETEAEAARRTPRSDDPPLAILDKLSLNGVKFPLSEAQVEWKGEKAQCFVLLAGDDEQAAVWVAPPIVARRKAGAASPAAPSQQLEQIGQAATEGPAELARTLRQAAGTWEAVWGREGSIDRPTPVRGTAVTRQRASRRSFVQAD